MAFCGCGRPAARRRFAARGVDREDGDLQAVALVDSKAPHQLVVSGTLAGAGARDAEDRRDSGF